MNPYTTLTLLMALAVLMIGLMLVDMFVFEFTR